MPKLQNKAMRQFLKLTADYALGANCIRHCFEKTGEGSLLSQAVSLEAVHAWKDVLHGP